jgi:hypothetical protein
MTAYGAHIEDVLLDSSSDSWLNAAAAPDDVTKRWHTWDGTQMHLMQCHSMACMFFLPS